MAIYKAKPITRAKKETNPATIVFSFSVSFSVIFASCNKYRANKAPCQGGFLWLTVIPLMQLLI